MREIYEALDDADGDAEMLAYRARYIAGEMNLERFEEAIEHRLHVLLHRPWRSSREKAPEIWVAADIARFVEERV